MAAQTNTQQVIVVPRPDAPPTPVFSEPQTFLNSTNKKPDKIRFLASDDFPPFSFRDGSGRLVGYNLDLARAICEELAIACSLQVKPFAQLIPALEGKEGDAIIAGLGISPGTLEKVSFSNIYMRFPGVFAVAKSFQEDPTPKSLRGKRVSVVDNSRHEAFLERFFTGTELISFDDDAKARAALVRGEVDAHFGDGMRLSFWLESEAALGCCKFSGGPWLDPYYFGEGMAIAVRLGDTITQTNINLALARLQSNGRLSELYLRYFPLGFF
ncbi:transporter substrate-binding domain-containing protein [Pseudovibrio flavus]|uniref:transporter substrate-binding domain-containing protein n=1 Tax=Pseudovibrio flavus TaxID=2529854 RepID=UPI00352721D9